jgi:hypothetical protein
MNAAQAIQNIRMAIDAAPQNHQTVELHVQMIKYADTFSDISGREFCNMLGISDKYETEFNKMRKIAMRLRNADLNTAKI